MPGEMILKKPDAAEVVSAADQSLLDAQTHVGVAVYVTSSAGDSALMIPDAGGVGSGTAPVFITKPVELELEKFKAFLVKKGVTLPEPAANLMKDTSIGMNAFYFLGDQKASGGTAVTKPGITLMSFSVKFNKGVISSLTGDDSFDELFDIKGISLRVLKCGKEDFPILEAYAKQLAS